MTPFERLSPQQSRISTVIVIIAILSLWSMSGSTYIPTPMEILGALPRLIDGKDIFFHFEKSLFFCFKAIMYSTVIALFFCYLAAIPMFRTFCHFLRKFRFLPSTGLSFLFMKITGTIDQQMLWMMIFGVTTWLLDSMIGVALSVTDDEVMYSKSLRLTKWQRMRELLIYGKASNILECIISNFAMAWMLLAAVENIAKASGGIGVVLAESNKYYKFEEVYAIQLMILLTGIIIDYLLGYTKRFLFPHTNLKH